MGPIENAVNWLTDAAGGASMLSPGGDDVGAPFVKRAERARCQPLKAYRPWVGTSAPDTPLEDAEAPWKGLPVVHRPLAPDGSGDSVASWGSS